MRPSTRFLHTCSTHPPLNALTGDILLLDGATGSELERRGVDIGLPLWSAKAIIDAPDVLKDVHTAYLDAGAGAITTNTFRTHERSLAKANMGHRAADLTCQAVDIAQRARDEINAEALVFGSVAPLEDCYSPSLAPDEATCHREHIQLISNLVDAGVDCVLIETMCTAHEARAAAAAAQHLAPGKWGICFCLSPSGTLLDRTPLSSIADALIDAQFVGVNCVGASVLADHVRLLRRVLSPNMPIAAYGNVGIADEHGAWVCTDDVEPERFAARAQEWIDAGATLVGGCCGTTPETIAAISRLHRA